MSSTGSSKAGKSVDTEKVVTDPVEAKEVGYFGSVPDETPNENYTLKGVTSGAPTPETERGK